MVKKRAELPKNLQKHIKPKASFQEVVQAEGIYNQGITDGSLIAYGQILNKLEQKYMGQDGPDRGTPEAIAILELAKELGNDLRARIEELNAQANKS